MPKLKDFYAKLKEQGKIDNPEYEKFLNTVADGEIPDEVVRAIEEKFFTFERAAAHKDIHGKIKREVLDPVDNELKDLFEGQLKPYIDPSLEEELRQDGNSYKKLKLMKKLIPEIIEKVKAKPAVDEDTKRKLAEAERNVQELTQQFATAKKEYNDQFAAEKTKFETQLHDFKLDSELQTRGNKFTLAEAYEQNRQAITKVLMSDIKASNVLKLGEQNGQAIIQILDEHGKPKFDGNTPITIDSLLEEKYKPFLKQSSSGSTTSQATQSKTAQGSQQPNSAIRQGARTTVREKAQ